MIIYSRVGSFFLPGIVCVIAEDPGDWQREPVKVNANGLVGCSRCGPAGLACGFSSCGKTAVKAVTLVWPRQAAMLGAGSGSLATSWSGAGGWELLIRAAGREHSAAFLMGLALGFIDSEGRERKVFSLITHHMARRQGGRR